jgi:hypothetical protein
MRKLFIILFLLIFLLIPATPIQSATMVSGRPCPGGVTASCTTPTGDELTESFGDSSSLCWTDGSSVCNNTWTHGGGTLSIEDSPGTPPSNTACAKSLKFDSTSAVTRATIAVPGGAIAGDEAVTINFSVYIDSSTIDAWDSTGLVALNNFSEGILHVDAIAIVRLLRNTGTEGVATHLRATGGATSCMLAISEDTWYDVTLTIPASDAGDQSTMAIAGGSSCNFTKDTDASGYIHVGASDTGIVGYIGNIRVTTP